MSLLEVSFILTVLAGTLRAATPLVFAGLGELINERGGVLNIGIEGLMLVGACVGIAAHVVWGQWMLSLMLAALAGGLMGLSHAFFCVVLRTNQIVTGLAFVFLCQGLTAVLGVGLVGAPIMFLPPRPFSFLADIPVLGALLAGQDVMVFAAILMSFLVGFVLWRTRWGILLRACGESAVSARSAGISVRRVRLIAGTVCGMFCGLGGAHLSLFYAQQWQENMMAGRGWIAVVLVIFSGWRSGKLLIGAWLFGGLSTLQLHLQSRGINVSQYLLAMTPFVATIIMYSLASARIRKRGGGMPADLGSPIPQTTE